jgi:EmrB/QacA subfamily drug resistance transporter
LNRPLALLVAGTLFMEILDGTIIATAAPAIAADLSVQPVDINLAMTAYLVTIAAGIPISGWLTDRFGGRRIFVTAVVVFTVASVLCAASVTFPMLVASRILQGLGGALMVPVGRLVVLRWTAKRDLLDVVAYLTWPALLAPVIAPALGGWILTVASWHWIFVINVPLGVVAVVAGVRLVPVDRPSAVAPLDWVGFVLSAAVLVALLSSLEVIDPGGGLSAAFLVGLGVTAALAALAVLWFRRARHPLLRFGALQRRSFRVGNVSGGVYRLVINATPFLLPLMFQVGFGWSPLLAGILVLTLFVGNVAIKPATSPLIRRWGFRAVLIGSIAGGAVIFGLIALLRPETPLVVIIAVLVLSGVFRSIGFSAYNSLQFADIDADAMTDANTLSSTMQQVALGLGIAVAAVVLRAGEAALGDAAGAGPYRIAFIVLSLLMLYPLVDAIRLPHDSGDEVAGRIS